MNRPRLSKLNLRNLFVRNLFVAVLILFAFAIGWITIPARAGLESIAAGSMVLSAPQEIIVEQTAVVDPMTLPPPPIATRPVSRPLRMRDPIAYRKRKAAMASGAILPQVPSMLSFPLATTPTVLANFIGLAMQESCGTCEPPDTQVAAGPNQVFEVDNVAGKIFDKSGNVLMTTFGLNGLFNLSAGLFTSDPRIEYDTLSNRWFISILSLDTGSVSTAHNGQFNLAVSTTSDPTQPFNIYRFATTGSFPDQPSLGFNDDKVVSSGSSFSCSPDCSHGPQLGNEFVVWNKSELLAGDTSVHTDFVAPQADLTGLPIIAAKSRSSTSTLFMASAFGNGLTIWSLTGVPGVGNGTNATTTNLTINSLNDPPNAKQKGSTTNLINTGDSRLLDTVFRDGKIWTVATSSCTPAGDTAARSCMRFIEVLTSGTPVLHQDFDFGTKGAYDFYPSVDLDSSDNLITSFTQSSSTEFASAFIDARLDSDPINTLGAPVLFKPGAATYKGTRWGDYSGAGIDPADETVIWLAAEYSATAGNPNWGTWIAEARVAIGPTPTPTATISPTPTPTATPTPPFGRMRISANHLDFAKVKVNSTKSLPLKIKNEGKFNLQVTVGTLDPPFGVNGGGTFDVPKGGSKTAIVTFQPLTTGSASQTLGVTSDDPKHPAKNIRVSGAGK